MGKGKDDKKNSSIDAIPEEENPQEKKSPDQADPECLLVSCSELVQLFTENFKLKCEESFLEESAILSIQKSIQKQQTGQGNAFKIIFVDLDDPTLMLGRFITSLNKTLAGSNISI